MRTGSFLWEKKAAFSIHLKEKIPAWKVLSSRKFAPYFSKYITTKEQTIFVTKYTPS